jgi:peptidoglycan/xylan/chitin deacetylase (PgdA/CDA1 family)
MQDPHNLFVRPDAFAAQLNLLADRGYIPLTLDEYLDGLDHKRWPARSYLVTFDDGYVSTLRVAAPLLAARDIPAILFVPGGRIGMTSDWMPAMPREPLLDADGLRAVTAFGIEVGVHGFDHRDMVALDASTLHEHTVVAKDLLADALGVTPRAFAYPRGRHDAAAVDAVRSAGYSVGFATVGRGGRFAEPRTAIDSTDTLRTFRLKTVAWWPWAMRAGRASPAMRRAVHALLGYEPRPTVASSPDGAVTAAIDDAPPSPRVR